MYITKIGNAVLLFLAFFGLAAQQARAADKHFVIIIPSYNNIQWYQHNLRALCAQNNHYTNWHAIYIDDYSTDGTGAAVDAYITQQGFQDKITVIHNKERCGALCNIYNAVHTCADDDVVVLYDGDDFLKHDAVLYRVNQEYQNNQVWMTYGQFEFYPGGKLGQCEPLPASIVKNNAYRTYKWVTTHLRTFYAGLFKRIRRTDLLYEGKFYSVTWDMALLFPMLEMAGEHIAYIPDVLYVYNCANPLNDFRVAINLQQHCDQFIRKLPRYSPLPHLDVLESN